MHVLNFDTIGGVETLYMNFLEYAWKHDSLIPITSICGKKAHSHFATRMKQLRYSPFHERYLYGIFLPKLFKIVARMKRWMISSISATPLSVYWNVLESKKPPTPFIFYDHGASWNYKSHKKYSKFWKECVATISVSEAAKVMLHHKEKLSCPAFIVPNPIRPDITIKEEKRSLLSSTVRLGFIGRLLPIKAPGIAIQTLFDLLHTYHIDATLTIAGVGAEQKFLENLVDQLNLKGRVLFLQMCEQIEQFYDSIDILLVPSLREPLGLVALEASARGVPVIATGVDGLAESVQEGISGFLVDPTEPIKKGEVISSLHGLPDLVYNPKTKSLCEPKIPKSSEFASCVHTLVSTDGLYETISQGGLQVAKQRSDFSKYCQDLLAIFHHEVDTIIQEMVEPQEETHNNERLTHSESPKEDQGV